MNIDAEQLETSRDPLTAMVIGLAYEVANTLGHGFLEKVYENALAHKLRKAGLAVQQQQPINVFFDGVVVGEFCADILVNGTLILELKTVRELTDLHLAQCLNYLKATGLKTCMLINFGKPRIDIKRISL
ncbi:MAG: GxxExxY protein [Candidatus Hydrogenedentes bacterium]|nr:GxxExxY protein [Candidatus Hydrogenedentota bacterium]